MQIMFPLPYDGSPIHNQSWEAGKAFEGRKVKVIDRNGQQYVGRVHRAELSRDVYNNGGRDYGVGFRLVCGQAPFQWDKPIDCCLRSIELVREPDYIRI